MRGQERALGQEPGLEQVLVRVPVPELEQVQVMEQAAQAWVLVQGQARVKAALVPAALKGRTVLDLVTVPGMTATARQMEMDTALVSADTAPVAISSV